MFVIKNRGNFWIFLGQYISQIKLVEDSEIEMSEESPKPTYCPALLETLKERKLSKWRCPVCFTFTSNDLDRCGSCDAKKPKALKSSQSLSQERSSETKEETMEIKQNSTVSNRNSLKRESTFSCGGEPKQEKVHGFTHVPSGKDKPKSLFDFGYAKTSSIFSFPKTNSFTFGTGPNAVFGRSVSQDIPLEKAVEETANTKSVPIVEKTPIPSYISARMDESNSDTETESDSEINEKTEVPKRSLEPKKSEIVRETKMEQEPRILSEVEDVTEGARGRGRYRSRGRGQYRSRGRGRYRSRGRGRGNNKVELTTLKDKDKDIENKTESHYGSDTETPVLFESYEEDENSVDVMEGRTSVPCTAINSLLNDQKEYEVYVFGSGDCGQLGFGTDRLHVSAFLQMMSSLG